MKFSSQVYLNILQHAWKTIFGLCLETLLFSLNNNNLCCFEHFNYLCGCFTDIIHTSVRRCLFAKKYFFCLIKTLRAFFNEFLHRFMCKLLSQIMTKFLCFSIFFSTFLVLFNLHDNDGLKNCELFIPFNKV